MLGTRPLKGCAELGRETFLAEVEWEDNWPVVNPQIGRILEKQNLTALEGKGGANPMNRGDIFWTLPLDMRCIGLRENPSKIPLKVEEGKLYLPYRSETIEDLYAPAFIGTRLLSRTFDARVELEANLSGNEEAGLVYFYDENHYIKAVFRNTDDGCEAVVIKRTGTEETQWGKTSVTGEVHTLQLQGKNQYLCVLVDQLKVAEELDLKDLCSERAGGFTGCTIGVYASYVHTKSGNNAIFNTLFLDFMD
jgi:alpha-N-arabinofuranosidase